MHFVHFSRLLCYEEDGVYSWSFFRSQADGIAAESFLNKPWSKPKMCLLIKIPLKEKIETKVPRYLEQSKP